MRSMRGSRFPAVSTHTLYGFRSRMNRGVSIGDVVFQGITTGSSGFTHELLRFLKSVTQLSTLTSATFLSVSALAEYFGWNCFR